MLSIKKSLIVLGALGAAILGNASGAHAFAPRFDTRGMWNSRQSKSWDAYGLRWDGMAATDAWAARPNKKGPI
jgi:hypothetical protein